MGIENKLMVFLFTDAHVADESFLELINNMLTSGGTGSLNYSWSYLFVPLNLKCTLHPAITISPSVLSCFA